MESVNVEDKNDTGAMEGADLVLGLLAPAPSAPFVLKRFEPDGSLREFPIRVRKLRKTESLLALSEALTRAKKLGQVDEKYGDIYRECQVTAILVRALVQDKMAERPDGTKTFRQLFTSAEQLENSLGEDEIAQCLNAYEYTKAKFAAVEGFDEAEIDKWAARLSDVVLGPLHLSQLDSSHWPVLLLSFAQEIKSHRESLGRPLPSLLDSSESSRPSSESGTGGFTSSLSERSSDGASSEPLPTPTDSLLSSQQARDLVKERRKRKPKP